MTKTTSKLKVISGILIAAGGLLIIGAPFAFHESFERGAFSLSIGIAYLSLGLSLELTRNTASYSEHQSVSNYLPSRALGKIIHEEYIKRCGHKIIHRLSPYDPKKYTSNRKHADLLLIFISEDEYELRPNIAKRLYSFTYQYEGTAYVATSATPEMAICIAFLKSCDHPDVRE